MCIAFSASFDAEGAKSRHVGGGENHLLLCGFWLPFQSMRSMQSDQPEVHSRRSSCMHVSRNRFLKPVFKTGFGRQFSKPVKNWFSKTKGAVSPSVLPSVLVQFLQKPQDNPQFLVVFVSFHPAPGLGENWEKPVL